MGKEYYDVMTECVMFIIGIWFPWWLIKAVKSGKYISIYIYNLNPMAIMLTLQHHTEHHVVGWCNHRYLYIASAVLSWLWPTGVVCVPWTRTWCAKGMRIESRSGRHYFFVHLTSSSLPLFSVRVLGSTVSQLGLRLGVVQARN